MKTFKAPSPAQVTGDDADTATDRSTNRHPQDRSDQLPIDAAQAGIGGCAEGGLCGDPLFVLSPPKTRLRDRLSEESVLIKLGL